MAKIIFFRLPDGTEATLAYPIEDYAISFGAKMRADEDGSRHPGSACNYHIKRILESQASRTLLQLSSDDYFKVDRAQSKQNNKFINRLISSGFLNPASIKDDSIDMYSRKGAQAICASMLNDIEFTIAEKDIIYKYIKERVTFSTKHIEKKRLRPTNSLFKGDK